MTSFLAATVSILTLMHALTVHSAALRGVDPASAHLYTISAKHFKCLDGSATILSSRVNDDYCDCPDGSDEPGATTAVLAFCAPP